MTRESPVPGPGFFFSEDTRIGSALSAQGVTRSQDWRSRTGPLGVRHCDESANRARCRIGLVPVLQATAILRCFLTLLARQGRQR
jgi:hypothetical protein